VETLNQAGVPCGPVHSVDQVFADPQIAAQQMVLTVPHPDHGEVRMLGFPMKLAAAPCSVRLPAPGLGEHSEAVLTELGYDATARQALRDAAVV
jgi:crotonobetainyl-CoA:carnitine CoA-transferase CaiB-like acyl-CoA transferase